MLRWLEFFFFLGVGGGNRDNSGTFFSLQCQIINAVSDLINKYIDRERVGLCTEEE